MFMPPDLQWLEPVLVASAIVFVVDLIGNMISFNNRILNALTTAIVFAVVFGAMSFFVLKGGPLPSMPAVTEPAPAPAPAP